MKTMDAIMAKNVNTVRDIVCQRQCLTFPPHEKVNNIIKAMHGHHSGAAAVIDRTGRMIGLITEREMLRRLFQMEPESAEQERFAEEDKAIMDLTAWDILIAGPECLTAERDIESALEEITKKGYRYMPVVAEDSRDKLLGIVDERELFLQAQAKIRRELEAKNSLLCYFMHHEPYGVGGVFE